MVSVEFTENFFWVKNGLWYVAWRHERKHGPQGLFLGRSSEWVSTATHCLFLQQKYSSSNTKCQRNKGPPVRRNNGPPVRKNTKYCTCKTKRSKMRYKKNQKHASAEIHKIFILELKSKGVSFFKLWKLCLLSQKYLFEKSKKVKT